MTNKDKLTRALLLPINPTAIIILGVYTFLWGFWVANPFWTVFTQADLYSFISQVAPEWFWGSLAMFVGVLTMYGAYTRKYAPLVRGACISSWHWLMIAIFYFMGDWANTGGITSLTFAVYGAFIFINLRVNKKVYHKRDDEMYSG